MSSNNNTTFPDIPLGNLIGISVGVFSSIGIIVNALVIIVLTISQRRRFSPYRYLITHLTLADLICAIFLLAYVPVELNGHNWIYDRYACKIIYPCITFCTNLSIGTILIIAVERYRGVIFPFSKAWKPWNIWVALIIVWIVSALIILPNILVITITKYENLDYCNEDWGDQRKVLRKIYGISFFFIAFFVPLFAIGYMNVHIVIRLKHRDLESFTNHRGQQNRDKRITRVLSAIVVCFFICILPNKLLYFVWDIAPQLETDKNLKTRLYLRTIQILYYARVAIDPLIYCFFDTRFKKDFANSAKTLRGRSFIDSDYYSRNRSKSMNSNRKRSSTNFDVRSRTSTCLSSDTQRDLAGYHIPSTNQALSIISIKETDEKINTDICVNKNIILSRDRSDSDETTRGRADSQLNEHLSCSASPLVEQSYMTNLDTDFVLTQLSNGKTLREDHERENSESSCDSTEPNSVYGSATPLVGEREHHD